MFFAVDLAAERGALKRTAAQINKKTPNLSERGLLGRNDSIIPHWMIRVLENPCVFAFSHLNLL